MSKINKAHGPGTIITGSQIVKPVRRTVTSGSLNIDAALGGGWALGHWVEVVGHESTGKTYLVLKCIAANQKINPEFSTVWFATEDFNEDYARLLGVDLSRVIIANENIMEDVFQQCIELINTKAVDCVVIDSLPFLVSKREDDGTMDDLQPGQAAFLTGKFFRKSQGSIKRRLDLEEERTCMGFVINGWREKIGSNYGDPRITPGGKGKNFVFFQRVDVSRKELITDTKNRPVGQTMQVKNIKNKYARPGLIGQVDAYVVDYKGHRAGNFDIVKDLVSAALAYDVIERDRTWHFFGEEEWYGRPKVDEAVRADAKLRAAIRKATLAAAAAPMPPTERPPRKAPSAKRRPTKSVAKTGARSVKKTSSKAAPRKRVRKSTV